MSETEEFPITDPEHRCLNEPHRSMKKRDPAYEPPPSAYNWRKADAGLDSATGTKLARSRNWAWSEALPAAEIPGFVAAEIEHRADLAQRIVTGFMEPSLRLPQGEWHLRYRAINRAAGVIAGWAWSTSCAGGGEVALVAQFLRNLVEREFAGDSTASDHAARIKLCEALAKRTAAVLVEMGL